MKRFAATLAAMVMLACCARWGDAQKLIWLPNLPGGNYSRAWAVSADGSVVVGEAEPSRRAVRWVRSGADYLVEDLGTLGGSESWAFGVSADGSVVVGNARDGSQAMRAYRWTRETGMVDLGTLDGPQAQAFSVSADGSAVVGVSDSPAGIRAYRWMLTGGMENLGDLGGGASVAYGISADGQVVVGISVKVWPTEIPAFRWTALTGMQSIGTLGGVQGEARAVNADGSAIAGRAQDATAQWRAFHWTASTGMRDLGTLGGVTAEAYAINADGSIVAGRSRTTEGPWHAARWRVSDVSIVAEDLNVVYASLLAPGDVLERALSISPDGRYIAGSGTHDGATRAWILDTRVAYSIKGNIVLGDFLGDITLVPVPVQLRQGGTIVRSETLLLDASGNYTIPDVEPGTYDLAFKASHWLRVVVPGVQVVDADVTGVDVSLTNGDIDGDNEVTLFDFGALVAAFGSVPGDGNWNPDADLDGDEEVTLFDFGVLVRNFGAIGDE